MAVDLKMYRKGLNPKFKYNQQPQASQQSLIPTESVSIIDALPEPTLKKGRGRPKKNTPIEEITGCGPRQ